MLEVAVRLHTRRPLGRRSYLTHLDPLSFELVLFDIKAINALAMSYIMNIGNYYYKQILE